MTAALVDVYAVGLQHARRLVADVADEAMARQAGNVVNHPAWTLGHLAMSAQQLAETLGLPRQLPDAWQELFDSGSRPTPERSAYPSRDELLGALEAQHARVEQALVCLDASRWGEPYRGTGPFTTLGTLATFLTTAHEWSHLGQIATWRRAVGLGPV